VILVTHKKWKPVYLHVSFRLQIVTQPSKATQPRSPKYFVLCDEPQTDRDSQREKCSSIISSMGITDLAPCNDWLWIAVSHARHCNGLYRLALIDRSWTYGEMRWIFSQCNIQTEINDQVTAINFTSICHEIFSFRLRRHKKWKSDTFFYRRLRSGGGVSALKNTVYDSENEDFYCNYIYGCVSNTIFLCSSYYFLLLLITTATLFPDLFSLTVNLATMHSLHPCKLPH
jgi:hypothetical protein